MNFLQKWLEAGALEGVRTTKRSRLTEDQIIRVLREYEAAVTGADLCRKPGISEATFYNWKSKYDGMEVFDARWSKALEDKNRKLKRLLAERSTLPS
jgi:putative transposase